MGKVKNTNILPTISKIWVNRNNASFVKNFKYNYEEAKISFFAAIELFSFGMFSKFFGNLEPEDKKAIAKGIYNIGYTYLDFYFMYLNNTELSFFML